MEAGFIVDMTSHETRKKWNHRHSQADGIGEPANVLIENLHLLPQSGSILDLACGRGGNALYLAEKTRLSIDAWDISDVAVDRVESEAKVRGLSVNTQVRDISLNPPKPNSFNAIVVTHFLDRALAPALIDALCLGGLLFYQTFTQTAVSRGGPSNPKMCLGEGELLKLFQQLRLRVYREEGVLGDVKRGWRNLAMLVAEKV